MILQGSTLCEICENMVSFLVTTINPDGGYNGGFNLDDVWAEQTWGSVGAVSFDGSFGYLGTSGVFYGGMQLEVSDDASTLTSASWPDASAWSGASFRGSGSRWG